MADKGAPDFLAGATKDALSSASGAVSGAGSDVGGGGGSGHDQKPPKPTASPEKGFAWVFDPSSNTWVQLPTINLGPDGKPGDGKKPPKGPVDPLVTAADSLYFQLWGQKPPPGYIDGLIHGGMNLYEIELHERQKPAFALTKTYQDERTSAEIALARFMGEAV